MSAGPGSKIRALSTPSFPRLAGFAGRGCAVAYLRAARGRGCAMAVYFAWTIPGCGARYLAVHGISLRGTGRVFAAPDRECGVFGWRSRNRLRFICRPRRLHGVFLPFAELVPRFLPFAESAPCFLPFEKSAVYVGDKFGSWPLDD